MVFQIDTSTAVAVEPTRTALGTVGFFTDGNPGGGVPATQPKAEWFNMVTKELKNVVIGAGLSLDKANDAQLLASINALIAASIPSGNMPQGYISGLGLSNNATDGDNDIDIAAGACRSSANSFDMTLASTWTKRLDAAWAIGTNNGGLFSGSKANSTWYHVFLIRRTSDGLIDAGFDTSATAANIPVGWAAYRRLGSVRTDSSGNIIRSFWRGEGRQRDVVYLAPSIDTNTTYAASARSLITVLTPPAVRCKASLLYTSDSPSTAGTWAYWTDPSQTDTAPDTSTALAHDTLPTVNGSARHVDVWTNTSSQVGYRPSESTTLRVRTYSYLDFL